MEWRSVKVFGLTKCRWGIRRLLYESYESYESYASYLVKLHFILGLEEVGEHASRQLGKRLVGWCKDGERAGA